MDKTDVIFRKDKHGVYALFPYLIATYDGEITGYMHRGQHFSADYNHCIMKSKPAKAEEYADLMAELENQVGYNLRIRKKMNHNKYGKALMRLRDLTEYYNELSN